MAAEKMEEIGIERLLNFYKNFTLEEIISSSELKGFPFGSFGTDEKGKDAFKKIWDGTKIPVFNMRDNLYQSILKENFGCNYGGTLMDCPIVSSLDNCDEICRENGKRLAASFMIISKTYFTTIRPGYLLLMFKNLLGTFFNPLPLQELGKGLGRFTLSDFEEQIVKEMIKMTEALSNKTLENISLLDLPAFGAMNASIEQIYPDAWANQPLHTFKRIWNQFEGVRILFPLILF